MIKMMFFAVFLSIVLIFSSVILPNKQFYGNVKLLDGYKYRLRHNTDTINGVIYKENGLWIEFESGINEGYAVDPKRQKNYIWFQQQDINGNKVYVALTTQGVNTKWNPEKPRNPKSKYILMVTFPGKFSPLDAANFYAEVMDEQEIADSLLMILTFDPKK